MNIAKTIGEIFEGAQQILSQKQDVAFTIGTEVGNFVVVGFSANESVNAPFSIELELASRDAHIDLHALMDTSATLCVFKRTHAVPRYFNGVVSEISRGDEGNGFTFYHVTLRPTLTRLAFGSDSRIWQQKSVRDIVGEVLKDYGVTDIKWELAEPHATREYCTQFRESHLSFISRLLAEEGIFYYFSHSEDSHQLVLTDAPLSTPILPHAKSITYNAMSGGSTKAMSIKSFRQFERLRSTSYELNDYTFKNPPANFKQSQTAQSDNGVKADYAIYDYPGRYKDPDGVGKNFVKHRMESVRVDATTGQGRADHLHLCAGYHFSITDHPDDKLNASHFLLSVSHSGQQSAALEEYAAGSGSTSYSASFTTMPGHIPFRPAIAPKPVMDGPQIAHVTGPAGEEIYCDEHGRVKVWFPWDRHGKKDESSSCWIRVSQNWAGGSWGHIAIPRIGQEVIVANLDGDIDQPIIIGRTYHASNQPPYKLPENKTRMSIKSQTHKGEGYNELRFEDEADKEEVWMHAQKDHNTVIENNETHQIGVDRSKSVGNNQSESVGNDKAISVGNDHAESIGNNKTLSVQNNHTETISGNANITVQKNRSLTTEQNLTNTTNQTRTDTTTGDTSWTVSQGKYDFTVATGVANYNVTGDVTRNYQANQSTTIGANDTTNVANNIVFNAGDSITLVTGSSSIIMESSGKITISGTEIAVNATSSVDTTSGGTINSSATGEHIVFGSILRLN